MGLLDLKTDLKSLKFNTPPASDRPGSGNSGQPYNPTPISSDVIPQSEDFLLRGGLNAPLNAANDVIRLTKMFGDLKSPNGILFVAKQNILSRIGVATQASGNQSTPDKWKKSSLNEGLYTPLSTLSQAGVGFTGAHLYKQGLNPIKGVNTYIDSNTMVIGGDDGENNRLVDLYKEHVGRFSGVDLYSYSGGPGSVLGVGKTNIRFATDNMGAPLKTLGNEEYTESFILNQTGIRNSNTTRTDLPSYNPLTSRGVTNIFKKEFNPESIEIGLNSENSGRFGRMFETSVYSKFDVNNDATLPLQSTTRIYDNGALTWDQEKIEAQPKTENNSIQDFRTPLLNGEKSSTIMSLAPSYAPKDLKTIEGPATSRINQESPGQTGNIIDYSKGKIIDGKRISIVDHINYQPLYKSSNVRLDTEIAKNDLVKFRIGAVLRGGEKVYMHFRAFIDSFSDSYSAEWSGVNYMGRGEKLYKYGGFSRKISLSYTVAAQSKPELMAQYKKLNFLASTLAPDYGDSGYMGGVLTTLTLGGWCYELPGMINSLTLTIPQESPWEIGIDGEGEYDSTVKEMPHICKVTMEFTPIHNFRPELQKNDYDESKKGEVNKYGSQHYIGLTAGAGSNYEQTISLADAQIPK